MFITLKQAADGRPITLNLDHIIAMHDAPAPASGTYIEYAGNVAVRVVETRAQILAEVARINERPTPTVELNVAHRSAEEIVADIDDTLRRDALWKQG